VGHAQCPAVDVDVGPAQAERFAAAQAGGGDQDQQRTEPRLVQIRDNLRDRITEAQQKNWLGEVEGLHVSLAAATTKLAQLDELATRRNAVHLGMPTFTESAGRTITIPCSF
jgi:hypothetical protein